MYIIINIIVMSFFKKIALCAAIASDCFLY